MSFTLSTDLTKYNIPVSILENELHEKQEMFNELSKLGAPVSFCHRKDIQEFCFSMENDMTLAVAPIISTDINHYNHIFTVTFGDPLTEIGKYIESHQEDFCIIFIGRCEKRKCNILSIKITTKENY